jgi:PAS domain S-box-containing protein
MPLQFNPYSILSLLSAIVAFTVAGFAWKKRGVLGAIPLALLLVAAGIWTSAYAIELSLTSLQAQIFWSKVEYLGIVNIPVLYLIFSLEYAKQEPYLARRSTLLLWIIPIIALLLTWTNELHLLIWSSYRQVDFNSNLVFAVDHGFFFWIYAAYSYLLLLIGAVILVQRAVTARGAHRNQAAVMVLGTAVTWLGNIVYLTGLSPIPEIDTSSLTLTISGLIYAWALFKLGLLDLVPIAGEKVLESLDDGALVLDLNNRIVYLNKAFEYYTGLWAEEVIGKSAEEALSELPGLYSIHAGEFNINTDIGLDRGDGRKLYINLRITPIQDDGKTVGRVFILHDITESKEAEQRLLPIEDARTSQLVSIPVFVVIRMDDGKIIEVNRSFIIGLGYQREEVIGRTPLELGIWTAEQRSALLRELRDKGQLKDYPVQFGTKMTGRKSFILSAAVTYLNDEGFMMWIIHQGS